MDWSAYAAVLFDLDGVITPTAEVHMQAWDEMFNGYLGGVPGQAPYTDADYFAFVDGKPRYDGVRDFLASRGITLPEGAPDDDPALETVCGLGNRKNEAVTAVIERDGVAAYPGSVSWSSNWRPATTGWRWSRRRRTPAWYSRSRGCCGTSR